MYMARYKNNPLVKLYYSDTDSIVIAGELPPEDIGPELGKFKLEHVIDTAIFLSPKVYGLLDITGEVVIKIKGLGHEAIKSVTLSDLEDLLFPDNEMDFYHTKMFKDLFNSTITSKQTAYLLRATSHKRYSPYMNCSNRQGLDDKCLYKTLPHKYSDIDVVKIID